MDERDDFEKPDCERGRPPGTGVAAVSDEQPTKTECEWEFGGEEFKVAWGRLFNGLTNEVRYEGWLIWIRMPSGAWYRQDGDMLAAAAAIARLAGLTVPEGGMSDQGNALEGGSR